MTFGWCHLSQHCRHSTLDKKHTTYTAQYRQCTSQLTKDTAQRNTAHCRQSTSQYEKWTKKHTTYTAHYRQCTSQITKDTALHIMAHYRQSTSQHIKAHYPLKVNNCKLLTGQAGTVLHKIQTFMVHKAVW